MLLTWKVLQRTRAKCLDPIESPEVHEEAFLIVARFAKVVTQVDIANIPLASFFMLFSYSLTCYSFMEVIVMKYPKLLLL